MQCSYFFCFPACLCNILTILIPRATWGCYLQSFPLQSSSDSLAKGGKWIQDWTKAKGEDSTFYHYSTSNLNWGAEDFSVWLERRRKSFLKRSRLAIWSRIMKVYQYTFELPVKAYQCKFLRSKHVKYVMFKCWELKVLKPCDGNIDKLFWARTCWSHTVSGPTPPCLPFQFHQLGEQSTHPPILSSGFYKSNICLSNLQVSAAWCYPAYFGAVSVFAK